MNQIVPTSAHLAILRYARGEIDASCAADLLGPDATIHDVIHQLREAGLEPPRQSPETEQTQLLLVRQILGLVERP